MKFEDLVGQRFDRLLVVYREAVNSRQGAFRARAFIELSDVEGGAISILGREEAHP